MLYFLYYYYYFIYINSKKKININLFFISLMLYVIVFSICTYIFLHYLFGNKYNAIVVLIPKLLYNLTLNNIMVI